MNRDPRTWFSRPVKHAPDSVPLTRRTWMVAAAGLAVLTAGFRRKPARAAGLRPPAALAGDAFEQRCIRCYRCAEVCPPKCIRFDSLLDLRGTDTPYIDAQDKACILCMKCTQACPTGALVPTSSDAAVVQEKVRMGIPVLNEQTCLPWSKKGICRLCYYVCPYPGSAITVDGPMLAPTFHAQACVGCGLCEEACPTHVRAIHIRPMGQAEG